MKITKFDSAFYKIHDKKDDVFMNIHIGSIIDRRNRYRRTLRKTDTLYESNRDKWTMVIVKLKIQLAVNGKSLK